MIRLAQHTDIEYIVSEMLKLRSQTGWAQYTHDGYTRSTLIPFVSDKLLDPSSVVYVFDGDVGVVAFCGVTLGYFPLPPHMLMATEWGWSGEKTPAVRCFQSARRWAKHQGAELFCRTLAQPGRSTTRIRESITWETL